jgi:hypothetical protein
VATGMLVPSPGDYRPTIFAIVCSRVMVEYKPNTIELSNGNTTNVIFAQAFSRLYWWFITRLSVFVIKTERQTAAKDPTSRIVEGHPLGFQSAGHVGRIAPTCMEAIRNTK